MRPWPDRSYTGELTGATYDGLAALVASELGQTILAKRFCFGVPSSLRFEPPVADLPLA